MEVHLERLAEEVFAAAMAAMPEPRVGPDAVGAVEGEKAKEAVATTQVVRTAAWVVWVERTLQSISASLAESRHNQRARRSHRPSV